MSSSPSDRCYGIDWMWFLSGLAWLGLGLSIALIAVLSLAPRWHQTELLQERYARNARIVHSLEKEIQHLDRLVAALENDPEFTARVASSELKAVPNGGIRIALNPELGYDPRAYEATESGPDPDAVESRFRPIVELMASSNEMRTRLTVSSVLLLFLVFICLNESFLSGGLREPLQRSLGSRYRSTKG